MNAATEKRLNVGERLIKANRFVIDSHDGRLEAAAPAFTAAYRDTRALPMVGPCITLPGERAFSPN
jgi:hypothetical protein